MLREITLAIATFVISLTSYTQSPVNAQSTSNYQISQNIKRSRGITTENLGIGGIKLSMTEAQVRKILGKPVKVENSDIPAIGKVRTLKYKSITVNLAEDVNPGEFTVYQINTNNDKYSTIDGVKVGDIQSKVLRIYGQPGISEEGKIKYLHYGIEEPSPAGFTFTIKNDHVTEIICFYVMN